MNSKPTKKPTSKPKRTLKKPQKLLFSRKDMNLRADQKRNASLFKKVKKYWPLSKISRRIFLIYLIVVLIGGLLLSIPGIVVNQKFHWNFLVGVFTASSGFSDTGINIANVAKDYSFWGQLITILLIEAGGIGILTFKIVVYLALNRQISLNDTMIAKTERGSSITSATIELIRDGFVWLTIVQIFGAFILFFAFFFSQPGTASDNWRLLDDGTEVHELLGTVSPYRNFGLSLWFAIYHSTSAINNAGFDIISGNSLQPYNVDGHRVYLIQVVFLVEWVVGGLGYPTFHDIKRKIKARRRGQIARFSLFTKLNFCVYGTLLFVGPVLVFISEYVNRDSSLIFNYYRYQMGDYDVPIIGRDSIVGLKPFYVVFMDIVFNTTGTRNAGFSTVNINNFNAGSKTIMSILMFIGSAPSSTAGGIRTTTFAIIILATWAIVRNNSQTTAFRKTIPEATVKRAYGVFFISMMLVSLVVVLIYIDSERVLAATQGANSNGAIIEIITLVSSAFGTVGMNPFTGTQMLAFGTLTKIALIIVMFLGQLGISNTLLVFVKPSQKQNYGYLREDVVIG